MSFTLSSHLLKVAAFALRSFPSKAALTFLSSHCFTIHFIIPFTYFSEGQLVFSICDRKVSWRVKVSGQAYYVSPLMLVGGVNVREVVDNHLLPGRQLFK